MIGEIRKAPDQPGTRWARPWSLVALTALGPRVLGRYPSERLARAAAARYGLLVAPEDETADQQTARRRRRLFRRV